MASTHEVLNQPPPLEGRNLFDDHLALVEALEREGGGWALERVREVGAALRAQPEIAAKWEPRLLALALQGSLLVRHAPAAVADAFCASRPAGDGRLAYEALPAGVDAAAIIASHTPRS